MCFGVAGSSWGGPAPKTGAARWWEQSCLCKAAPCRCLEGEETTNPDGKLFGLRVRTGFPHLGMHCSNSCLPLSLLSPCQSRSVAPRSFPQRSRGPSTSCFNLALKGLGTKSSVLGCVDEVWWSPPPLGGKPRGCLMQQKPPDTLMSLLRHVELPLTCPNTTGKEEPVPASPWK